MGRENSFAPNVFKAPRRMPSNNILVTLEIWDLKIILAFVLKATVAKVFVTELLTESLGHLLIFTDDFGTRLTVFSLRKIPTYILTHLIPLISTAL